MEDRVEDKEMRIIHCPAKEMWVDVLVPAKPLHGSAFRVMQAKLMSCEVYWVEGKTGIDRVCKPVTIASRGSLTSRGKSESVYEPDQILPIRESILFPNTSSDSV
jgi:hypothetical protein